MADFDPDAYLAAPPQGGGGFDPDAYLSGAASAAQPSMAGDIAKSAGIGVVKGGLGMAGTPGDIGSAFQRGADWASEKLGLPSGAGAAVTGAVKNALVPAPLRMAMEATGAHFPTTQELRHGLESVTGPLYEPKTTAGHYAQTIGEFVPAMIGGPEGIASRALTRVVAPAVASEAAGEAAGSLAKGTPMEPYAEPVARVAGALVGHGAGSGVRGVLAERPNIPSVEELHDAATTGYNNARGYGVEIRRKPVARLADDMLSDLGNDGFRERNVPKTWSAIGELKEPLGKHATIDDIESVRKALLRAGSNPLEGAEREASRRAIAAIDNYMRTLDPREIAVNPHYAADVARELNNARANWAAMKGGQAVLDKIEAADLRAGSTYSGTNLDNATRQNIRRFLDNPKLRRQLSPAEQAQAERVVRGTYTGNVARFVGKNLRWILGSVIGHDLGGVGGMLAAHGAGHALTHAGAGLTRREAARLADMVRADSPLGRSLPQPAPTIPASPGSYGLAGGLARQPGEQGQPFASGGAVRPPLSTRKQSNYSPTAGTKARHCANCAHYLKPNKCSEVGGFIAARGLCEWYRGQRAAGGRVDAGNINHAPTEAQKEAGNYAKDHIRVHGLDIAIENAKGAERSGVGKDGKPWSVKMPAHYGYIKRTEGADGDHVDVYLGPHTKSRKVFVVDQRDADTSDFDEHKVMMGFGTQKQAREAYHRGFSDGRGRERLGRMTEMGVDEFKDWLKHGNQSRPAFADGGALSDDDIASMTHQAEQPNPVAPIVDFGKRIGAHFANEFASAVTAPRDALYGTMQVTDPETGMPTREAMERGQSVANMAMTGAVPFAQRGAAGMAGGRLTQPTLKVADDGIRINIAPHDMQVPEWGKGLSWGLTAYRSKVNGEDAIHVRDARLPPEMRGQGHGTAMYEHAAELAAKEGKPLLSDGTVTQDAANRWMALNRAGYNVQMAPDKVFRPGPPEAPHLGRFETPDGSPVFRVEPAAAPGITAYHGSPNPKRARGGSIKFKPDWWIKAKARRAAFA